mmetsp:Transcript_16457/g.27503  ORF Transcript_16457/g.27503 Transcript_16457/m.27503 type:complete len:711 (-) Transcript_16457:289-2421(-)
MKFGQYLLDNKYPEWSDQYLDYDTLKKIIKSLEQVTFNTTTGSPTEKVEKVSLTKSQPTNAKGVPDKASSIKTQEQFFSVLEGEMRKIDEFTKKMLAHTRNSLSKIEQELQRNLTESRKQELQAEVDAIAQSFLHLEKYVNLNFTGFHKILKKHDKRLPNPCKSFYISRLHEQGWVKGDNSEVIVLMSSVYSALRGDEEVEEKESDKQDFVRSTTKYWVHTEDISRVKYIILQHLPVFLQKGMKSTDAQLVNSVYLDNRALELYHGRLDKSPGAQALRMRWYGTATPETVFVERKTHREAWTGEVSVKERFIVHESQVPSILTDKFDFTGEIDKMKAKGKKDEDIAEWESLATECVQAINSKQLEPTMRTQYMRTAFQIPFDATVRVSLDTNLCMIMERTEDVVSGTRWFRDPDSVVPNNEITRFPHAVLEVKLQLQDANSTPEWVTELIESGMLMQVHKFSKFIHGCATLMPDDVQAVPYWIDDPTLKDSITQSGAANILETPIGANQHYSHLIPHNSSGQAKVAIPRSPAIGQSSVRRQAIKNAAAEKTSYGSIGGAHPQNWDSEYVPPEDDRGSGCLPSFCWEWASGASDAMRVTPQKVEPKIFLANERTFMKWLHMAVIMSSASTGVLAFTSRESSSQVYAMLLLPVALVFIVYPLMIYIWRNDQIRGREASRWDDPWGPVVITVLLIFALCIQFGLKVTAFVLGG